MAEEENNIPPETETKAEVKPEPEITPEEVRESAENQPSTDVQVQASDAIRLQAARYAYIEKLENRLASDEQLSPGDLNDVMHCKAQVLLELVGVSSYAAQLPDNSPNRKAVDVLIKHLYKCYDKTENLRAKIMKNAQDKRSKKQWEEYTLLARPLDKSFIYRDEFMLPKNNVINLTNVGLTAGTAGMLSGLIKNPSESIKAQMPDLIEEFASKITGTDKETTHKFITNLLDGLTKLKNTKSMTSVLEGIDSFANLLSLKNGNAI